MTVEAKLIQIKDLLEQVLQPTSSSPYINSDEIDENDKRVEQALQLVKEISCVKSHEEDNVVDKVNDTCPPTDVDPHS